jgi:hypothetical protein
MDSRPSVRVRPTVSSSRTKDHTPNNDCTTTSSDGADFPLDSYVGHEFEIRELPGSKTGACKEQVCRHSYFKVSENDDQIARVNPDFTTEFIDNKIKAGMQANDLIDSCKSVAEAQLAAKKDTALADFAKCVQSGVAEALEQVHEEIAFQASVRKEIAANLENYTCIDESLESSADLRTEQWLDPVDAVNHVVHVKHDRPASRIHAIENFIRPEECIAMEEAAVQDLHDATVADGKGGSRLSENRKAKQAGIKVPWDDPTHPISRISRRVYNVSFIVRPDRSVALSFCSVPFTHWFDGWDRFVSSTPTTFWAWTLKKTARKTS